ncbi:MAG TPA: hypothetical protein VFU97_03790 [Xanthobacteraceae bacterium]|nr:hypothetical protein [Xanthobacteraceae bacterium]
MSPGEFAVRMSAADERFARARKRDIRDMRAALAEKTALLDNYFGASRHRAENDNAHSPLLAFTARGPLSVRPTSEEADVRKERPGA